MLRRPPPTTPDWSNIIIINQMNNSSDADFQAVWDPYYVVPEIIVAVAAFFGNTMVILAFARDKKLRRLTNYYVVSLAVADLLVALLGIPFAILSHVGLPENFEACLFTISLLILLCTISIFNLVAVSVDRYWAILFPLQYASCMTGRTALGIIICCWILGSIVGLLPLMGWHGPRATHCLFTKVMDYNYLVFLYFATIVAPSVVMGLFYARIYCVVIKQLRQISAWSRRSQASNRAKVKMIVNRKEVNAAKILFIIVLFFVLCWIPLYTINTIQAYCKTCYVPLWLLNATIILSHANSAINPLLYAYHLRDFRETFKMLLHLRLSRPRGGALGVSTVALAPKRRTSNTAPNQKLPSTTVIFPSPQVEQRQLQQLEADDQSNSGGEIPTRDNVNVSEYL